MESLKATDVFYHIFYLSMEFQIVTYIFLRVHRMEITRSKRWLAMDSVQIYGRHFRKDSKFQKLWSFLEPQKELQLLWIHGEEWDLVVEYLPFWWVNSCTISAFIIIDNSMPLAITLCNMELLRNYRLRLTFKHCSHVMFRNCRALLCCMHCLNNADKT